MKTEITEAEQLTCAHHRCAVPQLPRSSLSSMGGGEVERVESEDSGKCDSEAVVREPIAMLRPSSVCWLAVTTTSPTNPMAVVEQPAYGDIIQAPAHDCG